MAVLIKPDEGWAVGEDGAERGTLRGYRLVVYGRPDLADPDGLMIWDPKSVWHWEVWNQESEGMIGNGWNLTAAEARVEAMMCAWRRAESEPERIAGLRWRGVAEGWDCAYYSSEQGLVSLSVREDPAGLVWYVSLDAGAELGSGVVGAGAWEAGRLSAEAKLREFLGQ